MDNRETIGAKIVALRKSKGITQADLGTYLNVSYQAVSKWERDESCPDFITISRLAQFFNVPISYFEDNAEKTETAATAVTASAVQEEKTMLGVCKDCGKVVYEGDAGLTEPVLVCKTCEAKRKRQAEAKKAEERRERERLEQECLEKKAKERKRIAGAKVKGFICGGLLAAFWIVVGIIGIATGEGNVGDSLLGMFILALFSFTWGSQMFWDGFVYETTTFGGTHIGTPGVIFEFSLDGFIFLVVIKILFAILRFLVYIVSLLFFVIVAVIVSPFTFIPALLRVNKGDFM